MHFIINTGQVLLNHNNIYSFHRRLTTLVRERRDRQISRFINAFQLCWIELKRVKYHNILEKSILFLHKLNIMFPDAISKSRLKYGRTGLYLSKIILQKSPLSQALFILSSVNFSLNYINVEQNNKCTNFSLYYSNYLQFNKKEV